MFNFDYLEWVNIHYLVRNEQFLRRKNFTGYFASILQDMGILGSGPNYKQTLKIGFIFLIEDEAKLYNIEAGVL